VSIIMVDPKLRIVRLEQNLFGSLLDTLNNVTLKGSAGVFQIVRMDQ
jgi:hypothetical protein